MGRCGGVVPVENDDGKGTDGGFSPINARLPELGLFLTRASYLVGTDCVELKGSFADPAV